MTGVERVEDVTSFSDHYFVPVTLRDGTMITLRPIHPDDESLLAAFHLTLSEQSVYMRYFSPIDLSRRIERARLKKICQPNPQREVVLVAEWIYPFAPYVPMIIGVGRLTRCLKPDDNKSEFAMIISDEWQGHGLGRILLDHLIAIAQAQVRRRLFAYILPENHLMLRLCEQLNFTITFDNKEALLHATLDLWQYPGP